jgi:electron transport complex protein RnfB
VSILQEKLNNFLPQTQCTLCGYPDCNSYAQALATKKENDISLCVPGEYTAMHNIANELGVDAKRFIPKVKAKSKKPMTAKIIAKDCIGCMKCIKACPVDAIIGGKKKLHAIISQDCTGCELCIDPCPVDCIELFDDENNSSNNLFKRSKILKSKYEQHKSRLSSINKQSYNKHILAKKGFDNTSSNIQARKDLINSILNNNEQKNR